MPWPRLEAFVDALLDIENFDVIKLLVKNAARVLYVTRLRQAQTLFRLYVACQDQHGVGGAVILFEPLMDLVEGSGIEIVHGTNGVVAVGVAGVGIALALGRRGQQGHATALHLQQRGFEVTLTKWHSMIPTGQMGGHTPKKLLTLSKRHLSRRIFCYCLQKNQNVI